ncbi:hypothetical protein [Rosistilla ulvae]|uniref:hypothetical protein n=1 Tax=Rosistilla ulvae TaxID=1930277 RepID=UPI0011A8168C|nr:hypothetical protein [Rosistilla ulvae]
MRSLLASLFVLSLGILAALPFRKTSHEELEPPPLERSQVASLISPLEEIDVDAGDLSGLNLSEVAYAADGLTPRTDSGSETAAFPELPQSRRPFAEALVQPTALIPDATRNASPDPMDIANRSKDWNIDLPLKYVQPQTGLQVEEIARQPLATPAEATRGSLSWNGSPTPNGNGPAATGMRIHQAGSRQFGEAAAAAGSGASVEPTPNYQASPPPQPRARKRFFVYEPAG